MLRNLRQDDIFKVLRNYFPAGRAGLHERPQVGFLLGQWRLQKSLKEFLMSLTHCLVYRNLAVSRIESLVVIHPR
ncbi:MAG TPA: hypothetical protein VII25_00215 [Candidatus Acidoferrum sp.]